MLTVISIEQTPNPNALKFVVNAPFVESGSVTYNSLQDAGVDPLGIGLLRIPGVTSVFYMSDFITISKTDAADWDEIANEAENVICSTAPVLNVKMPENSGGAAVVAAPAADSKAFEAMTAADRLAVINRILDEEVRPALAGDGGGLQILGLEDHTVFVHYQGACGSCPTSTAGTLRFIETRLQECLSPKITLVAE